MITKTPLEYLQLAVYQIQRDVDWFSVPDRKGTNYSPEFRLKRLAEYQARLEQYQTAIEILKKEQPCHTPSSA